MEKHQTYDIAFSLGAACACSIALRRAGLQYASFPLDWMAKGTLVERAALVASRFDHWLDIGDFVYMGKNKINGLGMFRNERTGLTHLHDFVDGPIEASHAKVVEKYRRRESRLFSLGDKAKRILCVYLSRPPGPAVSDDELRTARRLVAETFPQATVELLHFAHDPGRKPSDRTVRSVDDGIFEISFDYADPERDVNMEAVISVLVEEGFTARDFRSRAERRAYNLSLKMKKYGVTTRAALFRARIRAQFRRTFGLRPAS